MRTNPSHRLNILLLLLCHVPWSLRGSDEITLSVAPIRDFFLLGEPVILNAVVENGSDKELSISWWTWDRSKAVIVNPIGVGQDPERKQFGITAGLHTQMSIKVQPGEQYHERVLVKEFVSAEKEGSYEVTYSLRDRPNVSGNIWVSIFGSVEDYYADLWGKLSSLLLPRDRRIELTSFFVHNRSRFAWPYQIELLKRSNTFGLNWQKALVGNTLHSGNSEHILTCLGIMFAEDGDINLRLVSLFALKSFGLDNFGADIREALRPYEDEIKNSRPITVGD